MARQIDHGYAWIALSCSCVLSCLVNGFWSALGVIFVEWEDYFDVTPADTSLVGSMCLFIVWGIGPIATALFKKLSHRIVVVVAGIITVSCLYTLTFVPEFWMIYIIMPLLGIGLGLCYQPAFTFFVYFFDKYFAAAHTINGAATNIGVLGIPPLLEYLISTYGWKGAFKIIAAIMANLSVCGMLLNKPEPQKPTLQELKTISKKIIRRASQTTDPRNSLATVVPIASFFEDVAHDFDISLFRNLRFVVHAIVSGVLRGGYVAAVVYIVPYSVSVGISYRQSSLVMLAYGASSTLIQLTPMGLVVDRQYISAANFGGIAHVLMGLLLILITFIRTYYLIVAVASLFGIMQGIGSPMLYVSIANSPGKKDKGPSAAAWFLLTSGIGSTIIVYISGLLYNYTGDYTWSMIVCGICLIQVGANLFCDVFIVRWQSRSMNQDNEKEPELFMPSIRGYYLETSV